MTNRIVSPHILKSGDHVYQRHNPWHAGTVSALEGGVSFTVTYDRRPREPRECYTYRWHQMEAFLLGKPPVEAEPIPVNVEAFGRE